VLVNTEGPLAQLLAQQMMRAALGVPLLQPPKDLPLTAEERARYVGTYALKLPTGATLPLRIFEDGAHLMSQATGQSAFRLRAQGDHVFETAFFDRLVRLTFTVQGARAAKVTLLQGGARATIEGTRVE
jgi:hypothetical protein